MTGAIFESEAHRSMDTADRYGRALDQTARIAQRVGREHFGLPTPCAEWDVQTLLNHMVAGNWNSAAVAEESPRRRDDAEDLLGDNPGEAYRRSAEAAKGAWKQQGRLDRTYEMPMGTLPGQAVLSVRLLETVTHGWDLATATGQAPRFDADVVQEAMDVARSNLAGERPPGFPFAPVVEVADDLPAIDRLAAFMGRRP
ncbi:MAG: TIGR03086 family metal-binding protein [Chloroflexota bacterium]